ncbi:integrase, catalytic region, zinc finger, CCHC-type containing protein [Tanacetum coccineum]
METIHVKFDELTAMAFECNNLEPGTNYMNFQDSLKDSQYVPSKTDLDDLFGPLYEECYATSSPKVSDNSAATTLDNENTSLSSSIVVEEDEAPQIVSSSTKQVVTEPKSPILNENTEELDPSNMHKFHQQHRSTDKWTKNHPIEQVIGDPSKPVMTRNQLHTDAEVCMYALTVHQSPRGIFICQSQYTMDILEKHGMGKCDTISTPMATTKLDADLQDTDHAGCNDDCKSTSGGIQFLGDKLVSWSSKKQDCTAMSTAEAECVSLSA